MDKTAEKNKFVVTIKETLSRSYVVEADIENEAHGIITNAVESGEIVLDSDDYTGREISVDKLSKKEIKEGWWDEHPVYPPKPDINPVAMVFYGINPTDACVKVSLVGREWVTVCVYEREVDSGDYDERAEAIKTAIENGDSVEQVKALFDSQHKKTFDKWVFEDKTFS